MALATRTTLDRALDALSRLGDASIGERVEQLRSRLRDDSLRILVVGEAKRGKSTLINTLLQRRILPTGVTPVTAIATTLTHGTSERVEISYRNGSAETTHLDRLGELVTEEGNPGNRLGLRSVVVYAQAPLLERGIDLVDTPGTGTVNEANTAEAELALGDMDAAVFVLTVDPPISATERDLLHEVSESSVATFVVLNKADRLDATERAESLRYTEKVVDEIVGHTIPVWMTAANGAEPGIDEFRAAFEKFLRHNRSSGVLAAIRNHTLAIADQQRDEVLVTSRTIELRSSQTGERVDAFAQRLADLSRHHRDATDRLEVHTERLLRTLNDDMARRADTLRAELHRELPGAIGSMAEGGSPIEIERSGKEWVCATTVDRVQRWRADQAAAVQHGLDTFDARLRDELDAKLDSLRPAARELLGIELSVPVTATRLVEDRAFHYTEPISVGEAAAVAAVFRHRIPGSGGRRRALAEVDRQIDAVAPRQLGRARGDLQQRLTETKRAFLRALDERYGGYARRLGRAIDAATDVSRQLHEQGSPQYEQLRGRLDVLDRLRKEVESADDPLPRGVHRTDEGERR